ncbi:Arm DNA-binding domain-containing protein [Bacteroides sp. AN502(2024)]|uniref:Arm DNA-binding domain-containing protein n=1 Tax=Bacteroides sp. AN502(2024) TaxID=3160599 RepID=UPI003516A902
MSETIKVVCYKYKTLSNGESPLMIRICKDGKKKYQSLGISVKAEQWDFKTNQPKDKCPNRERIAVLISEKINEIQKTALDKRIAGKDFTATTLIESATNKTTHKTVGEYYLTYIRNLQKENRIRYAGMFEVSYSSFIKFNKHLDISVFSQ